MYKVLIVDDEEFVIKSLIRSASWEEYGFEVVSSYNDGIDAFEAIIQTKPHLVFTDIRMPGMSGLELIKNVKENLNNILFVVISGHAEFAYAQKALNYGAVGYCLKPFDDDEINSILKKARYMLDKTGIEGEYDIISLIEESSNESSSMLDYFFKKSGIAVEKGMLVVASIGSKQLTFKNELRNIRIKTGSFKYVYFVQYEEDMDYTQILPENLPDGVKGVGVCDVIYSTNNLRKYIDDATTLAYQFFITGKSDLYIKGTVDSKVAENLMKEFKTAVAKMDIDEIKKILMSITHSIKNNNMTIKHAINIYNTYVTFSMHVLDEESYEDYVYSIEELCALFKDANAMAEHIKATAYDFVGRRKGILKEKIKNEYFKKIIEYVNQNFYKDISVQSLSQEFVINPNYISQLFRKEVGMTFTDYVTKLKIDYSKELLEKTKFSLGEIANKCGYTDYFYFIRVFKKITNLTPGQFRQMKLGEK